MASLMEFHGTPVKDETNSHCYVFHMIQESSIFPVIP